MIAEQKTYERSGTSGPAHKASEPATAEAFFRGLLAALAAQDHRFLRAGQATFHRAFYRVVQELKSGRVSLPHPIDLREIDFDPLYGLSGLLDLALTRAQRDSLVSFANPSYRSIEIRYTKSEGLRRLNASDMKQPLEKLSTVFLKELEKGA